MKRGKHKSPCLGLVAVLIGTLCSAQSEALQTVPVAPVTATNSRMPEDLQQKTVSRLQELEKKAAERDLYLARARELQKKLDLMTGRNDRSMLGGGAAMDPAFGQLSQLKEKATLADQLARQVEKIQVDNKRLVAQRDEVREELKEIKKAAVAADEELRSLQEQYERLEKRNRGLQDTIGRLLLGEFEYYEVKEGETLQSIAANPLVYGDVTRSGWLRQANEGRVPNLERLRDGDMLVVPRFPRTGAYEF